MKMPPTDSTVKPSRPRRGRWLVVLVAFGALAWSLPRPQLQEVVVESDGNSPRGRLAFRTAEPLAELSGKGALADETELSGPCFADDGQTLYFSRSRPGQRADIVRSTLADEHWSKPEVVREFHSVDDDRRLTLSGDGLVAAFASNRSGGHGGFDIYESAQANDQWSRPRNAGPAINTEAAEFDPALTPDGLTMYFVRVIPDASADIFVTRRDQLDSPWSPPQPVESVNTPNHHERSPALSPDGSWLLFASNRGERAGESAPFGLFRAPLRDFEDLSRDRQGAVPRSNPSALPDGRGSGKSQPRRDGHVGTAERLRDGLASDADDVDAAFAPNGQSLVFASKRDGAKQIFISRGEFVASRLTYSTEHLDRFGPRKELLPIVACLFLILVWRWSRRGVPVAVAETATSATTTIRAVPRRSEPAKNPLAGWTPAPLEQTPKSVPAVNPLTVAKSAEPTTSVPDSASAEKTPSRRRRWAALAVAVAVSMTFVLLRTEPTDQTTSNPPIELSELGPEFAQLADLALPHVAELPKLERTSTARTDAPHAIAPPSHAVTLRPGARWPTDRITVRQRSELTRIDDVDQRLLSRTKPTLLARQPLPTALTKPLERSGEETLFAVVAPVTETPHGLAPTTTAKQAFAPSAAERTAIPPVVANQLTLRTPTPRLAPLALATSTTIGESRRDSLARNGAVARNSSAVGFAEPEALIGTIIAKPTVEPTLPAQVVSLPRTESVLVGQPTQLNSSLPSDRRVRPMASQAQTSAVTAEASRPTNNVERAQLPGKSPAAPKAVPLTEGLTTPAPRTSSAETNPVLSPATAQSPATALSRGETRGPQPTLTSTSNSPATSRADLAVLRTTNRLAATEKDTLTTKTTPTTLARREALVPAIASIAAVETTSGMGNTAPAILLTSASTLVELLTSAPLPTLPRAESASPATSTSMQPSSPLAPWISREWRHWTIPFALPTMIEPNPISKPSLPRRVRETVPAELVESIPAAP